MEDERPIVELPAPPPFVPVVAKKDERLEELKGELKDLAASLKETQLAVEDVAKQRDQAREEVRALAKANHEMLGEMKAFRQDLETARQETAKWKEHAAKMERKANDQALANAALKQFREELQGAMKDFEVMKGDIAKAREEFVDPIERSNLKAELAKAKAKQDRLGDEIEMALVARQKSIQESARMKTDFASKEKDFESKLAALEKEVAAAASLRDELRAANAVKMKALADVEVLRKSLVKSESARGEALAKLDTAQNGLTALQAEKAAAMEAKAVASQQRDEARSAREGLQKEVDVALERLETSEAALAEVSGKLKQSEEARAVAVRQREAVQSEMGRMQDKMQAAHKELATTRKAAEEAAALAKSAAEARKAMDEKLDNAAGALEKSKEEVVFLNKAKGGLEALLFKKTAEIRQLKGELRKVQASQDKSSKTPTPGQEEEGKKAERATAQAFAD